MIRRAAGFGMNVVIWSRRFDGAGPAADRSTRRASWASRARSGRSRSSWRRRPATRRARADILSVHVALEPGDASTWSTPALLAQLKPGAIFINTARGEVIDHAALAAAIRETRPEGRPRRLRAASRPAATGGVRRSDRRRCPASTARITSAPRPIRRRRRSPPRRSASSAATRKPAACRTSSTWRAGRRRRTCSSSAIAIAPACWRTSSTICAQANLNVQETENIVFEGAEAAVARINLDGAPTAERLRPDHGRQPRHPRSASSSRSDRSDFTRHFMSTTTTARIHNFSAGPAVLPLEVLEEAQRNLLALPGVGMSILEISHRSKTFEDILAGCEADLRTLGGIPDELQDPVPAGRRQPAVLDGADEPAAGRRLGRLHRDRRVVAEGGQGSEAGRRREDRRDHRGRELHARAEAGAS